MLSKESIQQLENMSRLAGKAMLAIYQKEDLGIESKSDDSPLTLADKASNEILCEGLQSLAEQYPIISEENKNVSFEIRSKYDRYWLVDPLDGTKEFIKKNGEFTTNVALIENGRPIAGFIFIPVQDSYYYSIKGQGAYRVDETGTTKLECQPFSMNDSGLTVVASRSHLNEETQAFLNRLHEPNILSRGSSLKFLAIAEGTAHVYPRLAPTMEWDTGAAQAILEEAGGSVLQAGTDQPMVYNKENLLNPHFIAQGKVR